MFCSCGKSLVAQFKVIGQCSACSKKSGTYRKKTTNRDGTPDKRCKENRSLVRAAGIEPKNLFPTADDFSALRRVFEAVSMLLQWLLPIVAPAMFGWVLLLIAMRVVKEAVEKLTAGLQAAEELLKAGAACFSEKLTAGLQAAEELLKAGAACFLAVLPMLVPMLVAAFVINVLWVQRSRIMIAYEKARQMLFHAITCIVSTPKNKRPAEVSSRRCADVDANSIAHGISEEEEAGVPQSFKCPITLQIMRDPVIDPEGNTYERSAIESHLRRSQTSPMTRSPLTVGMLQPNRALKEIIESVSFIESVLHKPSSTQSKSKPDSVATKPADISLLMAAVSVLAILFFVAAPNLAAFIPSNKIPSAKTARTRPLPPPDSNRLHTPTLTHPASAQHEAQRRALSTELAEARAMLARKVAQAYAALGEADGLRKLLVEKEETMREKEQLAGGDPSQPSASLLKQAWAHASGLIPPNIAQASDDILVAAGGVIVTGIGYAAYCFFTQG